VGESRPKTFLKGKRSSSITKSNLLQLDIITALELHSVKVNSPSNMQSPSPVQSEVETGSPIRSTSRNNPDLCPVCSVPAVSTCRTCKKIAYCSKEHQRSHWKVHKIDCFPVIEQEDEILGRRLIATRNIKQGEIILREKPLISGPKVLSLIQTDVKSEETDSSHSKQSVEEKSLGKLSSSSLSLERKPICLGCLAAVTSDYLCPSCSWPVCGPTCAENIEHKENECEIFASHQVKPFVHLDVEEYSVYEAITILRGVILKERDPPKWKKLTQFYSEMKKDADRLDLDYSDECSSTNCFSQTFTCNSSFPQIPSKCLQFCKSFLENSCGLSQFTEEDINLVLKVMRAFAIPLNNNDDSHHLVEDLSRQIPWRQVHIKFDNKVWLHFIHLLSFKPLFLTQTARYIPILPSPQVS
jgi:hypothetical protein